MLKYPCLVLDHDDTVVASESTVNHPFFQTYLDHYRPGMTITFQEYLNGCFDIGYAEMCRQRFQFTEEEMRHEYESWKEHIRTHIPSPYPGIERIIHRQKAEGGLICVVSMSSETNIRRDYLTHFGMEPDAIFSWDLPAEKRKPNPWALFEIMRQFDLKPDDMLVIDDTKSAVPMAHSAGINIGFAGWGRTEFPKITAEMKNLCDYTFFSTEELEKFLFEEE